MSRRLVRRESREGCHRRATGAPPPARRCPPPAASSRTPPSGPGSAAPRCPAAWPGARLAPAARMRSLSPAIAVGGQGDHGQCPPARIGAQPPRGLVAVRASGIWQSISTASNPCGAIASKASAWAPWSASDRRADILQQFGREFLVQFAVLDHQYPCAGQAAHRLALGAASARRGRGRRGLRGRDDAEPCREADDRPQAGRRFDLEDIHQLHQLSADRQSQACRRRGSAGWSRESAWLKLLNSRDRVASVHADAGIADDEAQRDRAALRRATSPCHRASCHRVSYRPTPRGPASCRRGHRRLVRALHGHDDLTLVGELDRVVAAG